MKASKNYAPWTENSDVALSTMYARGCKYAEIGERLGRSEKAVAKRVSILKFEPRKKPATDWSDLELEKFMQMYNQGQPNREICKALNKSASSVSGKIYRMIKSGDLKKMHRLTKLKPSLKRVKRQHFNCKGVVKAPNLKGVTKSIFTPDAKPSKQLNILELRANTCRYITSDTTIDAEYCGHEIQEDSPYCSAHHELCHMQGSANGKSKNPMGKRFV